MGRFLHGHAEGARDLLCENTLRLDGVQLERAADEVRRVDVAEDDVGVGDRRCLAARVVAHRSGRGAGAFRADLQRAGGVEPHQRAAARSDFREVDRRHLEEVARAGEKARADHDARADRVLVRARHLAILDHRRLRGGAAHVEGDDLGQPLGARERLRADHAARRARFDDVHRQRGGGCVRGQAAVRLHEKHARAHTCRPVPCVARANTVRRSA